MDRLAIATVGHTIVQRADGKWIPSRIYQEIEWVEQGGPIERTHIDKPDLDRNSQNAYLGGAEVVCRAMAKLAMIQPSAEIGFIGGRPPSMNKRFPEVTDLTESSVMADFFSEVIGEDRKIHFPFEISDSCNTGTDMRDLARFARSYYHMFVICMGFRLPRCRALLKDHIRRNGDVLDSLRHVTFVDAEQFLPEMFDEFVDMNQSEAYANTMSQERFGVRKLLGVK